METRPDNSGPAGPFGVSVLASLPPTFARTDGRRPILLYDAMLDRSAPLRRRFGPWLRRHPLRLAIDAGEAAKSASRLPALLEALLPLVAAAGGPVAIVGVGGGSVGDLSGFVASILHRGVPLSLVPTTWLAAMDSAHGGKNALNVKEAKNVVGTFHLPERVWLSREVLLGQPESLARAALGEAVKAALLDGGKWIEAFRAGLEREAVEETLWKFLPEVVEAKYRVVRRDPEERKGYRRVLNFGHTVGHVLEAAHGLPHGLAVAEGMRFAVRFGERMGVMPPRTAAAVRDRWLAPHFPPPPLRPLPRERFRALLAQDKKKVAGSQVAFVFLERAGRPRVRPVGLATVVAEARRQGLCR